MDNDVLAASLLLLCVCFFSSVSKLQFRPHKDVRRRELTATTYRFLSSARVLVAFAIHAIHGSGAGAAERPGRTRSDQTGSMSMHGDEICHCTRPTDRPTNQTTRSNKEHKINEVDERRPNSRTRHARSRRERERRRGKERDRKKKK